MRRERLLIIALLLFLIGMPLVSLGHTTALVGLGAIAAGCVLTIAVHFIHGSTCDERAQPS